MTVGLLASVTVFNGGKSQGQSWLNGDATDFAFINLLKMGANWTSGTVIFGPSDLDANGWPLAPLATTANTIFQAPSQVERPGYYVIKWKGTGAVNLYYQNAPGGFTLISGSMSGTNGRCVLAPGSETQSSAILWGLQITATTSGDNLRDVVVCHVDDEAAYDSGQIFGIRFKQLLAQARFGVWRFLDWTNGNQTNLTTWATRKPVSYFSYAASEMRSSLYAATTTVSGDNYLVIFGSGAPVDKQTIILRFDHTATSGACTLNLNGTGAQPLKDVVGNALSAGNNNLPVNQCIGTAVWDATLGCWLLHGGFQSDGTKGLTGGVPYEICVRLCIELGMHPWFPMPYLAVDPMTDFVTGLATYIKNNAPAWMVPRFEGTNESWNTSAGFYAPFYLQSKATAYINAGFWTTGWTNDWYGKIMSTIGQAVNAVYGGTPSTQTKYQVVCGVQTVNGVNPSGNGNDPRLTSAQYLTQTNPAQAGYIKDHAYNWVTHICIANYWGPDYTGNNSYLGLSWNWYVTGSPSYLDQFINVANNAGNQLPTHLTYYQNWHTWANSFGPAIKLTAYEGGYNAGYFNSDATNAITGASNAASCVLTIANNGYAIGTPVVISGVGGMTQLNNSAQNATVTFSNSTNQVTWTAHGFSAGQAVVFNTTGALYTGLKPFIPYYVLNVVDANTFTVAATSGGAQLTFSGSQSGTQTGQAVWVITAVATNTVTLNVNSNGFGTYTASTGTLALIGSHTYFNLLEIAAFGCNAVGTLTIVDYNNFIGAGGEFPSVYNLAGASFVGINGSDLWALLSPSIYFPLPPAWNAIVAFNN